MHCMEWIDTRENWYKLVLKKNDINVQYIFPIEGSGLKKTHLYYEPWGWRRIIPKGLRRCWQRIVFSKIEIITKYEGCKPVLFEVSQDTISFSGLWPLEYVYVIVSCFIPSYPQYISSSLKDVEISYNVWLIDWSTYDSLSSKRENNFVLQCGFIEI